MNEPQETGRFVPHALTQDEHQSVVPGLARSLVTDPDFLADPDETCERAVALALPHGNAAQRAVVQHAVLSMAQGALADSGRIDETEELLLQQAMDRVTKLMATLSSIEKKVGSTSDAVSGELR